MAKKKEDVKFEEALKKLEHIVEQLEQGEYSLDESLKAFNEGMELSRMCATKLEEAEKKIEILTRNKNGKLKKKPYDVKEEADFDSEEIS